MADEFIQNEEDLQPEGIVVDWDPNSLAKMNELDPSGGLKNQLESISSVGAIGENVILAL